MQRPSLITCPFCEGEARFAQTPDSAMWHYVECSHCFTRQLASQTIDEAAYRWNVRGRAWSWRSKRETAA